MFDCGYRSQFLGGQREKFVRLDDLDSRISFASDTGRMKKCGFNIEGLGQTSKTPSKSFRVGMQKGSEGLKTIGRTIRLGVSRGVFPEELKVSEKRIFDPQDKFLILWNRLFVISCIISVSVDPLFFFLPIVDYKSRCLGVDQNLANTAVTVRTIIDGFYVIHMALQFRTAFIAPSSRVFGRGELVIDSAQIAKRYLSRYFIVDFLAVLPLPQIVTLNFLHNPEGSDIQNMKNALLFILLIQYIPRFFRILPLTSDLKRTAGAFAETAWAGAAYYLVWFMLASHIVGAFWYLLAVERVDACWHLACSGVKGCNTDYLYCGNQDMEGYNNWGTISKEILNVNCSAADESPFDFGIYKQALSSGIIEPLRFLNKYCYCLWWGLQNLRRK